MDFKVGDRVRTNDGKDGRITFIGRDDHIDVHLGEGTLGDRELTYLSWQLTRVEPPESKWLLTEEQISALAAEMPTSFKAAIRMGAQAALRLVGGELRKANHPKTANSLHPYLYLEGDDWATLQKAVGLAELFSEPQESEAVAVERWATCQAKG